MNYKYLYFKHKHLDQIGSAKYIIVYPEYTEFINNLINIILNEKYCDFIIKIVEKETGPSIGPSFNKPNCKKIEKNMNRDKTKENIDKFIKDIIKIDSFFKNNKIISVSSDFISSLFDLVKHILNIMSFIVFGKNMSVIFKILTAIYTSKTLIALALKPYYFIINIIYLLFKQFIKFIIENKDDIINKCKEIFNDNNLLGDPNVFINGNLINAFKNIINKYGNESILSKILLKIIDLYDKNIFTPKIITPEPIPTTNIKLELAKQKIQQEKSMNQIKKK